MTRDEFYILAKETNLANAMQIASLRNVPRHTIEHWAFLYRLKENYNEY